MHGTCEHDTGDNGGLCRSCMTNPGCARDACRRSWKSARVHAACSQLDRGAVGESELAHSHCILAKLWRTGRLLAGCVMRRAYTQFCAGTPCVRSGPSRAYHGTRAELGGKGGLCSAFTRIKCARKARFAQCWLPKHATQLVAYSRACQVPAAILCRLQTEHHRKVPAL